jgi:hypothetical protein
MFQMQQYASTPGSTGRAAGHWPAQAGFRPSRGCAALVLFLHPHCPCSRATIEQLNRLLVSNVEAVEVFAIFVRPVDSEPDWEKADQWHTMTGLPGVRVFADDGRARREFGAATSGEAYLYAADGRLLFHGGITGSRGHAGDNAASRALAARIADPELGFCATQVFGCPLTDDLSR